MTTRLYSHLRPWATSWLAALCALLIACSDDKAPGAEADTGGGRRGDDVAQSEDSTTDSSEGRDAAGSEDTSDEEVPLSQRDDIDGDGLDNECEDSVEGLDATVADSDGDGLDDGEEDANHNCQLDEGETDPTAQDSDEDGLTDFAEPTFGTDPRNADSDSDGLTDGAEIGRTQTDPLDPDSDDDGCVDGVEDPDGNGVIGTCPPDAYSVACAGGETDPNDDDTDGDGVGDCEEVGYVACAPEALREPQLVRSEAGDYTLALETDVVTEDIVFPAGAPGVVGTSIDDEDRNVAGFAVSLPPPSSTTDLDALSAFLLDAAAAVDPDVGRRSTGRVSFTHDEFNALVRIVLEFPGDSSPADLRAGLVRGLTDDSGATVSSEATFSGAEDEFGLVGVFEVLSRSGDAVVVIGAITTATDYADDSLDVGIRVDDLTGGTALARFAAELEPACVSYVVNNRPQVDFIWSIDGSGSMSDDRDDVSAFAADFVGILERSEIDWRVGVIGGECNFIGRDAAITPAVRALLTGSDFNCSGSFPIGLPLPGSNGQLCDGRFLTSAADFSRCIDLMSEVGGEFTLSMGTVAIDRALPRTTGGDDKFRPGAQIVLIVVTDEHEQSFEDMFDWFNSTMHHPDTAAHEVELAARTDAYLSYLGRGDIDATVFGIYWVPDEDCSTGAEVSLGIHRVATGTGGIAGSVCLPTITTTLETIAEAALGLASTFRLSGRPVGLTIKVAHSTPGESATDVPRSRADGFDFDSAVNRVTFQGTAIPETNDEVTISYQRWVGGIIACDSDDDCPQKFYCRAGECI